MKNMKKVDLRGDNLLEPCVAFESEIPSYICDNILDIAINKQEFERGLVFGQKENLDVRKNNTQDIAYAWINCLLNGYIGYANYTNFNYDLSSSDQEVAQVSRYCEGDYYTIHNDYNNDKESPSHTRKISMSVQLSDSSEYEGGDLILYEGKKSVTMPKSKGTIIIFDSRMYHEITEVTSGTRYALIKWYHGDIALR